MKSQIKPSCGHSDHDSPFPTTACAVGPVLVCNEVPNKWGISLFPIYYDPKKPTHHSSVIISFFLIPLYVRRGVFCAKNAGERINFKPWNNLSPRIELECANRTEQNIRDSLTFMTFCDSRERGEL